MFFLMYKTVLRTYRYIPKRYRQDAKDALRKEVTVAAARQRKSLVSLTLLCTKEIAPTVYKVNLLFCFIIFRVKGAYIRPEERHDSVFSKIICKRL